MRKKKTLLISKLHLKACIPGSMMLLRDFIQWKQEVCPGKEAIPPRTDKELLLIIDKSMN